MPIIMPLAELKDILETGNPILRSGWRSLLWGFVIVGSGMFIYGLYNNQPERTWQIFLVNTLFWGGIAQAGVMLSVIWQITDAKWGRPYKRVAECFSAFLPLAFLTFIAISFGASHLFEWVHDPLPAKASYLNLPFFLTRNTIGLGMLLLLSRIYVNNSLLPDLAEARALIPQWGGKNAEKLLKNYDHNTQKNKKELNARRLAPALALLYAVVFSMVAFDYVMSLDQEWFSTLFGVFFFVGNLYSALALMLIIIAFLHRKTILNKYMTINRYNDLAKLTFAIAMLYVYMAFSQYLVIWYSNLAEEAPFLVTRSIAPTPWRPLFWILFGLLFVLPFITLISRTICRTPIITASIALVLLIAQWWAHYLLVVPSIQDRHENPQFLFGLMEILITLGFGAMFLLSVLYMMRLVPILPISDKHLCQSWHGH